MKYYVSPKKERVVHTCHHDYEKTVYKEGPSTTAQVNKPLQMIFTQIVSALALAAASVSALTTKDQHCAPRRCKGINCLETLARINFQPEWCGATLMEKLARRAILRPDVQWNYNPVFDTVSPCEYMETQDPSLEIAIVNSNANITCSTIPEMPVATLDFSYVVHAAWSTNHVKAVNYNYKTYVAVPLYFLDGTVEVVVFAKNNTELPAACCGTEYNELTQCRRYD